MIRDYVEEIVKIIRSTDDADKLKDLLSDYHEKDIAEAITMLTEQERVKLYDMLDIQTVAEIFSYIDDVQKYLEELTKHLFIDTMVVPKDSDIDLEKIERSHIKICDKDQNIYIVLYIEGQYNNEYYKKNFRDKRDIITQIKYMNKNRKSNQN